MLNQPTQDDKWLQCLPEILDFDLVYFDDIANVSASLLPAANKGEQNAAVARLDK